MNERYFQMASTDDIAEIVVYGDITSWPWMESDVSSWTLSKQLAALPDTVKEIFVRINSYGGEVAEGVAIYNALKAHPANVVTVCDGFACSIASVIFMAGDRRVMNEASLLMIHNASGGVWGTAEEMRKTAEDMDTITDLSKKIYLAATDLEAEELASLMDAETWVTSEDALTHGFATEVTPIEQDGTTQDARKAVAKLLTQKASVVTVDTQKVAELFAASVKASLEPEPCAKQPEPKPAAVPKPENNEPPEEGGTIEKEEEPNRLLSFFQAISKED